jgi:hypothetical protein
MVLGTPLPEYKPGKFPFFVTKFFYGRNDSTNFNEKEFSLNFWHTTSLGSRFFVRLLAYEPQASTER